MSLNINRNIYSFYALKTLKNASNREMISFAAAKIWRWCIMKLLPPAVRVSWYLEGEVEVLLYVSVVVQQLSQTMSQLLQGGERGNRLDRTQMRHKIPLRRTGIRTPNQSCCLMLMHCWKNSVNASSGIKHQAVSSAAASSRSVL